MRVQKMESSCVAILQVRELQAGPDSKRNLARW